MVYQPQPTVLYAEWVWRATGLEGKRRRGTRNIHRQNYDDSNDILNSRFGGEVNFVDITA